MDLQPHKTLDLTAASNEWVASRHGTDATDSITLDLTAFTAGTHYPTPATGQPGFIPGGTPVKKSGNVYVPAATDDTTADGYVFMPVAVNAGATKAGAALLWHGEVIAARLNNAFAVNAKPSAIRHI